MQEDKQALCIHFLSEIDEIDISTLPIRDKYIHLKRILERSCKELTKSESLQFPSLFSRLVFIAQRDQLPPKLEWKLQNLRVKSSFLLRHENNLVSHNQYEYARKALANFFFFLSQGEDLSSTDIDHEASKNSILVLDKIRVQVLKIEEERKILICQSEVLHSQQLSVKYNIAPINKLFNDTIARIWVGAQLNLIDVKIDADGFYIPNMFVLEPDYLVDASAMAECFQNYGNSHLHYLRRKLELPVNTHYILLGNLANFFLDELIYAEDAANLTFNEVFLKSFRQTPFEYASCTDIKEDNDFRLFMDKAERHFDNIKRVVLHDMPRNGFEVSTCLLEPSFFCEKYGFQGRLDLLQLAPNGKGVDRIIELKSGKPPYPSTDVTKIAANHETQTAIYRLMIQSVFGKDARQIYPTILYSAADNSGENIRFAAIYQQLEKEIINLRNQLVATEHDLYMGDEKTAGEAFNTLFDLDNYGRVPAFFEEKLGNLHKTIEEASALERIYFYRYINFISRELYLQKMGDEGLHSSMSVSALWNTAFEERRQALDLIADLQIDEIDSSGRDMKIRFKRKQNADFVNFRVGEICILYPHQNSEDTVLTNQILKGVVAEISARHVVLRFRYKQRNQQLFSRYTHWAVEHDKLDHSYNAMFKSLFAFLLSPPPKKELLLGICTPRSSIEYLSKEGLSKDEKQDSVLKKALAAEDYFIIVGPPGTGKTSIFARNLIRKLYADDSTNILVIAYTNRAVDELCEAITEALDKGRASTKYIRIGSELACGKAYRNNLLGTIAHKATSRKELTDILASTRIFVGTLASIVGKPELFDIKKFNVAIVDEASQILEPQIIGLLTQFDKFILIGDHKQLSTITLQNETHSKVVNKELNDIALTDCRESLFERLFRICQHKGWTQAYDTLTYHGRMHQDIASLVNAPFYGNILSIATDRQAEDLNLPIFDNTDSYQSVIANKRIAFFPVRQVNNKTFSDKTNEEEASIVVSLLKALLAVYKANKIPFDTSKTVGVITPYRNQIALIKHKIEETGIAELADIMVDTVERYQGSQRDVVIISFCFNRLYQLANFSNMDREGTVDRKLNVALTRAREQLFLVGNEPLLKHNPIYRRLLEGIDLNFKK